MTTALIVGAGGLPRALAEAMPDRPLIAAFDAFTPDGVTVDLRFRLERLAPFLSTLQDRGVTRVAFAGAIRRPRLDPALIDPRTAEILPPLIAAFRGGDDGTLRAVIALFEDEGFAVAGVGDLAPHLLPGPGLLCGQPTATDTADATRAATIVAALGAVDVGQGAVVQQGLCLAVEALPGTDEMLRAVAALPAPLRPDSAQGKGVFYKAAKAGQDLRIDLPTIGPGTLRLAADAGLSGIAWQAGHVICLDPPAMTALAGELGLFLWSRP